MQRIGNRHQERLDELKERLAGLHSELETAVERFNQALRDMGEQVSAALTAYNEAVQEAQDFADEVQMDMADYHGNRPEKWQESERGQMFETMMGEWEVTLEEADIDLPEEIEIPGKEAVETLEGLPISIE